MIDFTRAELRELEKLIAAATGRFPDAFYTAEAKIQDQLTGKISLADTVAGMAWWNALSPAARDFWVTKSGGASAADAWEFFNHVLPSRTPR